MKTVRFGLKFQKKLKTGPFFFLSNLLFQGQDWTVTLNCLFVCFKSFKFVASINCSISAPHCPLEPSIYCHSQSSFISDFFESCTHKTRDCTKGGKGALKLVFQLCKKRKAKALPSVMSIFLKPLYCHYTQVLWNFLGNSTGRHSCSQHTPSKVAALCPFYCVRSKAHLCINHAV